MQVKPGQFYNQTDIDKDLANIKDYFGDDAAARSASRPTPVFDQNTPGVCTVQYEVVERPPARVGQVFIVGNDAHAAERHPPPGAALPRPGPHATPTCAWPSATWTGWASSSRGSVRRSTAEDDPNNPDSEYKDILVKVKEDNTGSLLFGVGVNSDAGLTGSIVLNERNFDITRLPTSIDDLLSGSAFRGAGQEFRVEAVPGTAAAALHRQLARAVPVRQPVQPAASAATTTTASTTKTRESRLGGRVTLGRKLEPVLDASSASMRVEDVDINNVPAWRPAGLHERGRQQLPGRLPGRR